MLKILQKLETLRVTYIPLSIGYGSKNVISRNPLLFSLKKLSNDQKQRFF